MEKRKNRWLKTITVVAGLIFIFGIGVEVGRGNLHVNGLSYSSQNKNLPAALDYSSVDQVYSILKSNFDGNLDKNKLLDGLKEGLVSASGDPYTEYFNPKDAKELNQQLSGTFTGIGAELGKDGDDNLVIVSPLSGYPAEKAGLKPQDVIAAINGQSTNGLSVTNAVRKIRGDEGTKVTLAIVRNGGSPFEVEITRTKITIPSVEYKVEGNIGYIKISQFTNDTTELVSKAAEEFRSKNVKGIVLDLRGNPGGYLNGAVDISSMWLPRGQVIVKEKKGNQVIDTQYSSGGVFEGTPTVVLINNGSASASEITAGALKDNGAASLVGVKSFGKGSVQKVETLRDGSEVKVTIAHWFTPKDKNIDKQGIKPDVEVVISDADAKAGKDPQKDKAFQIVQQKIDR